MTTVLVVDDSPMIREMVSSHLTQHGFKVVEAGDGAEAIEKIQAKLPDLIVTDVVMPRMNGYELCRWIKSNAQTKNLPVVMCTTKSEEFDKYWGMKQGADAYITKPYQPPELLNILQELLSKIKGES